MVSPLLYIYHRMVQVGATFVVAYRFGDLYVHYVPGGIFSIVLCPVTFHLILSIFQLVYLVLESGLVAC